MGCGTLIFGVSVERECLFYFILFFVLVWVLPCSTQTLEKGHFLTCSLSQFHPHSLSLSFSLSLSLTLTLTLRFLLILGVDGTSRNER
jgi:hypothetical protein